MYDRNLQPTDLKLKQPTKILYLMSIDASKISQMTVQNIIIRFERLAHEDRSF